MNNASLQEANDRYLAKNRFGALDGLRFLAILGVLFHHSPLVPLWGGISPLFLRGYLGVDFFFVISGFLITTLLLRERDRKGQFSLRGFYWRRALRILPLYYLTVTLIGGYYVLFKGDATHGQLWPFYYLFMANFMIGDIPMLSPTWSLAVEEQYYMLWPLLLMLLPPHWLLRAICAVVVLNLVLPFTPLADKALTLGVLSFPLGHIPYVAILMGSALALLLHYRPSFQLLWSILGAPGTPLFLGAALLLELMFIQGALTGISETVVHLTMALFLGSLVIREDHALMPALSIRPIVRIGQISYGIYLLHHIARHVASAVADRLGGIQDQPVNLFLFIVLFWGGAVILAELSFRFYETPFLNLRHKSLGFVPRDGRAPTTNPPLKGKDLS